jgi:hypothetical protein
MGLSQLCPLLGGLARIGLCLRFQYTRPRVSRIMQSCCFAIIQISSLQETISAVHCYCPACINNDGICSLEAVRTVISSVSLMTLVKK